VVSSVRPSLNASSTLHFCGHFGPLALPWIFCLGPIELHFATILDLLGPRGSFFLQLLGSSHVNLQSKLEKRRNKRNWRNRGINYKIKHMNPKYPFYPCKFDSDQLKNSYLRWEGRGFNSILGALFLSFVKDCTTTLRTSLGWRRERYGWAESRIFVHTSLWSSGCTSTSLPYVPSNKLHEGPRVGLEFSSPQVLPFR